MNTISAIPPATTSGHFTDIDIVKVTTDFTSPPDPVDGATGKVPLIYLSDDKSLEQQAAYIAGKWVDNIYVPICSTLGIVGNLVAFCVLVSARGRGSTTYVYMASMSLSDSMVQLVNVLFFVRKFPGHETIHEGTCQLIMFFMYYGTHCSVAVMVTMTVERYLVLRYPLRASVWFTLRRAILVVAVECVLMFGLNVQHFVIRQMYHDESSGQTFCKTHPGFTTYYAQKIWPWLDGTIYCYIPLICLVVFNVLILRQIRLSTEFQSQTTSTEARSTSMNTTHASSKVSSQEIQLTRMLLLVTVTFIVCVSPMAIIIVVERYFWLPKSPKEQATYYLVRVMCNNLVFTNHALNFFLYCFSGRRFRRDLSTTLSCLCPAKAKAKTFSKAVQEMSSQKSRISTSEAVGASEH